MRKIFRAGWKNIEGLGIVSGIAISVLALYASWKSVQVAEIARDDAARANRTIACLEATLPGQIALREDVADFRTRALELKSEFDADIMNAALSYQFGRFSSETAATQQVMEQIISHIAELQGLRDTIPGGLDSGDSRKLNELLAGIKGAHMDPNSVIERIEEVHARLIQVINAVQARVLSRTDILGGCSE